MTPHMPPPVVVWWVVVLTACSAGGTDNKDYGPTVSHCPAVADDGSRYYVPCGDMP